MLVLRLLGLLAPVLTLAACASAAPTEAPPREPPPAGPVIHMTTAEPGVAALYRIEREIHGTRYGRSSGARGGDKDHDTSSQIEEVDLIVERLVCVAPCDRQAPGPPGQAFFVGGEGVTPSSRFRLDASLPRVDLKVVPGSLARHDAGVGLIATGATSGLGSIGTLPFGALSQSHPLLAVGETFLGVALATLAIGIPLLMTSKTRVSILSPADAILF